MKSDKPIPLAWGKALTIEEQNAVRTLRGLGCNCDYPQLAFERGKPLCVCFSCGTVADLTVSFGENQSKTKDTDHETEPILVGGGA